MRVSRMTLLVVPATIAFLAGCTTDLQKHVTLKGSFCCGQCAAGGEGAEDGRVTIRIENEFFHTPYQDAEACFNDEIKPRLEELIKG